MWAGYAACGWAVTYGCVLLAIALDGGSLFGLPHGAWVAAPLLLAAAVAAAATVRPWGRRLPRRAVSAAVWTAAVLALGSSAFVLMNLIELATTGTVRDRHGDEDWAGFIERGCFAVGAALLVATALSWHHRTAGSCPRCGRAHSPWAVTALEYPRRMPHRGVCAGSPTPAARRSFPTTPSTAFTWPVMPWTARGSRRAKL
ncbi:hypothetical protein ACFQX6_01800 [Streptosporangium lutulentum]